MVRIDAHEYFPHILPFIFLLKKPFIKSSIMKIIHWNGFIYPSSSQVIYTWFINDSKQKWPWMCIIKICKTSSHKQSLGNLQAQKGIYLMLITTSCCIVKRTTKIETVPFIKAFIHCIEWIGQLAFLYSYVAIRLLNKSPNEHSCYMNWNLEIHGKFLILITIKFHKPKEGYTTI